MTIAAGTNWGHNFTGLNTAVAVSSAAPTSASEWICGWVTANQPLTSIVDSVNGAVPTGQIISYGTDPGATGFTTWFFYTLAGSTTARTFTANFSVAAKASIIAFGFTGLAATNPLDQAPTPGNTGSGTTPLTNTTGTTQAANEVVLFYWMLDHVAAATVWSGPPTITGFSGGTFAGLGNLANSGAPQFDAGYYIISSTEAGSASITSSLSDTWMGCIATMSATPITGGGGGGSHPYGTLMGVGT